MLNATLRGRTDLSGDRCVLRVCPDAGVPAFEPGQFVRLGLSEGPEQPQRLRKRAYSIVSAPSDGELELYVVKIEPGSLTPDLFQLAVGDRLWVDDKTQGELTLTSVPADQNLVMIATGTGIAPFISMLRAYAGQNRWRRFVVVHGARSIADLGYRDELERLCEAHADIGYVPVVSREPLSTPWPGLRGRVLQVLEDGTFERLTQAPFDPARTRLFVCGNPEMVESARRLLTARGYTPHVKRRPGTLHMERYW